MSVPRLAILLPPSEGKAPGGRGAPLDLARLSHPALTPFQLRRAFEESAVYPGLADYDPVEAVFDLGALPVNDAAPYAQVGWGDLTAAPEKNVVPAALLALGGADLGKDPGFCDFQTAVIEVRMAYWNEVAPFVPPITGERVPGAPDQNPFVYC